MEILGHRRFVEITGTRTHELPPLLVHGAPEDRWRHLPGKLDKIVGLAANIVESEDLIDDLALDPTRIEIEHERRKMDLALNLVDQYAIFVRHWNWGDSILEWIRQCQTTFETRPELRPLLRGDVWPHAGRKSFVELLADKAVNTEGVGLERAVGTRLSFRQPPPIVCCSNQFLFYLNGSVANSAYETWARMSPDPVSALPPERFEFQVHVM
jgi:hypothetical protein